MRYFNVNKEGDCLDWRRCVFCCWRDERIKGKDKKIVYKLIDSVTLEEKIYFRLHSMSTPYYPYCYFPYNM